MVDDGREYTFDYYYVYNACKWLNTKTSEKKTTENWSKGRETLRANIDRNNTQKLLVERCRRGRSKL